MELRQQAAEFAAGTPPVTVAGMAFYGYPLSDWVQMLAALWLVVQIGYFIWSKFLRKGKKED